MTVLGLEKWGDSLIEEKLDNGNTIYYVEKREAEEAEEEEEAKN